MIPVLQRETLQIDMIYALVASSQIFSAPHGYHHSADSSLIKTYSSKFRNLERHSLSRKSISYCRMDRVPEASGEILSFIMDSSTRGTPKLKAGQTRSDLTQCPCD